MPRARIASGQSGKPAVLHQTIEIPQGDGQQQQTSEHKPDFWTYMRGLTQEEWKEHIVYITRELPKTGINGVGGYLTKLQQPFDIEDIKQAFGGQEFSYIMNRNNKIVYCGKFRVEAPPKFDTTRENPATVNGGGSSSMETAFANLTQQFIGALKEELARSRDNGAVDDRTIDMLTKASDKAVEMVTRQVPERTGADPADQLEKMLNIAKTMGLLGNGQGGALKELVGMLSPFAPVLMPLLQRLLNPPDPLAQITTYLGLFEKLDALRGESSGGSGRRRDWKEIAVEKGLELAPRILDDFAARRQAAEQQPPQRPAQPQYRQVPPAAAPAVSSPQFAPAGADASPPAPVRYAGPLRTVPLNGDVVEMPLQQQAAVAGTIDETSPAFTNWIKGRIVALVELGQSGESIVDFMDGALPGFSEQLVQQSPDIVMGFLALDPILHVVTRNPKWPQIFEEARAYILEEEPEPVGAAKVQ